MNCLAHAKLSVVGGISFNVITVKKNFWRTIEWTSARPQDIADELFDPQAVKLFDPGSSLTVDRPFKFIFSALN